MSMNDLITITLIGPQLGMGALVWTIISAVVAVAGTVCVFVLFLTKKNENKFKGFLGWLYDFLNFKKMGIEIVLRVTYVALAIFVTLYSFTLIGIGFVYFILLLTLGNVYLRLIYELLMLFIRMCNNVSEINKKMK